MTDSALQWPPPAGTAYRPSSGTEGLDFMDWFCARCVRDKAFRDSGCEDGTLGCPIAAAALCFDSDDPNYPREWQYDKDGHSTCTAFTRRDDLCPDCDGHGYQHDRRYRCGYRRCLTCKGRKYVGPAEVPA